MERIKRLSLWMFYGLLAYMPLHIFLSTWLGTSFGILEATKIAKDVVLVIGSLFAFCTSVSQPWFGKLLKDRLVWLIVAYSLLTVLLAVVKPTDLDAEILGVVYNLRFLLFFIYGMLLAHLFDGRKLLGAATKIVLMVGGLVVIFGILQYIVLPSDILTHVGYSRTNGVLPAFFIDDKPDLLRVMSTVRDPNSLGSYLIIIGPLAAAMWAQRRYKNQKLALLVFVILVSICVGLTFSRSAWLGFALAMLIISLLILRQKKVLYKYKRPLLVGGMVAIALIVGGLSLFRENYFIENTIFHADESTTLADPNELRVRFFHESIETIAENPLGVGPGTAGLASIRNDTQGVVLNENYYLQIASEVGIGGLLLFLAILGMVGWRLLRLARTNPPAAALLASLSGLLLTNFLVHIWSNEAVAYTWWGLAGLMLASAKRQKRT